MTSTGITKRAYLKFILLRSTLHFLLYEDWPKYLILNKLPRRFLGILTLRSTEGQHLSFEILEGTPAFHIKIPVSESYLHS